MKATTKTFDPESGEVLITGEDGTVRAYYHVRKEVTDEGEPPEWMVDEFGPSRDGREVGAHIETYALGEYVDAEPESIGEALAVVEAWEKGK